MDFTGLSFFFRFEFIREIVGPSRYDSFSGQDIEPVGMIADCQFKPDDIFRNLVGCLKLYPADNPLQVYIDVSFVSFFQLELLAIIE